MKGGFIPSIMEGFCAATSKYIVPITLLIIHRMMRGNTVSRRKGKTGKEKARKRKS